MGGGVVVDCKKLIPANWVTQMFELCPLYLYFLRPNSDSFIRVGL